VTYGRTGRRDGRRFSSQRLTAMQLMPSLAAWWEPGRAMTVTSTTDLNPNFVTGWSTSQTIASQQFPDPLGGNSASQLLERVNAETHWNYYGGSFNMAGGPGVYECWLKSVGGRNLCLSDVNSGEPIVIWNGGTGAILSQSAGAVAAPGVAGIDGWWFCSAYHPAMVASTAFAVYPIDGTTASYAGDVTKGVRMFQPQVRQHRASALADQSPNGYDLAQSTAALQPFVQMADGTSPGGNTFAGRSAVWQPNDANKKLLGSAGLSAVLVGTRTMIAKLAALDVSGATFRWYMSAEGSPASHFGVDGDGKPYMRSNTLLTAADALGAGPHILAWQFDAATNTCTIYNALTGAILAGPTVRGAGGVGASVEWGMAESAFVAGGVSTELMSVPQIMAVGAALAVA